MPDLREQLDTVKRLIGFTYGEPALDAVVTDVIVAALSQNGINDLREFGKTGGEFSHDHPPPGCVLSEGLTPYTASWWVNKATDKPLEQYRFAGAVNYFNGSQQYAQTVDMGDSNNVACLPETVGYDSLTGEAILRGSVRNLYVTNVDDDLVLPIVTVWDGHLLVDVYVTFAGDVPIFYPKMRERLHGRDFWIESLVLLASFVSGGIATPIANAVFGSFAVAYPAVSVALVNVALQTALNGGDLQAALIAAATSAAGSGVGNYVGGVADNVAVGRLTASAVTARLRGGDVNDALAMTALQLAPGVVGSAISSDTVQHAIVGAPVMDDDIDYSFGASSPVAAPINQVTGVPVQPPSVTDYAADGSSGGVNQIDFSSAFGAGADFTSQTSVPLQAPGVVNNGGSVPLQAPTLAPAVHPDAVSSDGLFNGVNFASIASEVGSFVTAAMRVNQAYQAMRSPPVQAGVQSTASGATQVVRTDGTLATTNPATGQMVITRPTTGVPYRTADGGVVINNGNGSYTLIAPSGAAMTRPYPSTVPPEGVAVPSAEWITGVPNAVTLIGAAVIGALLLKA